ncbi:MAG: NifU family protein [Brumimicrobium sp.]
MGRIKNKTKLESIILNALEQLRPYLHKDGGDVEFVEITNDNVVKIKLLGNCNDCSMSNMTMKVGIEQAIREVAPEINSVEAV